MFDKIKSLFGAAPAAEAVPAPPPPTELEQLQEEFKHLSLHLDNVKARRREVASRIEELKGR